MIYYRIVLQSNKCIFRKKCANFFLRRGNSAVCSDSFELVITVCASNVAKSLWPLYSRMRFGLQIVLVIIPINCIIVNNAYSVNQLLLAYQGRKTYFIVSSLFTVFPLFPYEYGVANSNFQLWQITVTPCLMRVNQTSNDLHSVSHITNKSPFQKFRHLDYKTSQHLQYLQ